MIAANAGASTVFSDNFSTSTLNSASPSAPTATSTSYELMSSKSWSPSPTIGASDLKFGIASTSSGHIEAQALFSPAPLVLTNTNDFVELTVTFTDTAGILVSGNATSSSLGFGL